jgi:hypothetical protein
MCMIWRLSNNAPFVRLFLEMMFKVCAFIYLWKQMIWSQRSILLFKLSFCYRANARMGFHTADVLFHHRRCNICEHEVEQSCAALEFLCILFEDCIKRMSGVGI